MNKNIMYCCRKYLNGQLYLEIRNRCTFYVYFIIQYKFNDKFINKSSKIFGPGKKEHLLFPSEIENFNFKIFNVANVPPTLIVSLSPLIYKSTCYEVTGNDVSTQCTEIPC